MKINSKLVEIQYLIKFQSKQTYAEALREKGELFMQSVETKGKCFVAEVIRQFDIELEYIPLNKERMIHLQNVMENQNLVKNF